MHKLEQGVVLITGLIFLLVLTILGISAVSVNTQQERMAGNARDRNLAFQASEAALRDAERNLSQTASVIGALSCSKGLCVPQVNSDGKPVWRMYADAEKGYAEGKSIAFGGNLKDSNVNTGLQLPTTGEGAVSKQPRYLIETLGTIKDSGASKLKCDIGNIDCYDYFRVSAVGFGRSEKTRVEVQDVQRYRP